MYFKRLELVGFKSFSEKTTLHFEPGITAVVGPNGCGKSNIFDSIRWVLGEQSAKSLRGSDMLDVIFNGTDKKEALGMAEVTLAFDNSTRFFNVDQPEVAITRRLYRSGESEYLLNKTQVRLKDILDILLGTGIGAESYSIVAQGKIDLVLSSRPEDRRLVFDEAAGITKYKSQKRETMRRLEETEQNLLRVNDIIAEVKRQITSLERQASKARRYKEVFEELKEKEVRFAILQKKELLKQKDELIAKLRELQVKELEFLEVIREQEAKIANRQSELEAQEEKMMAARNQILTLENQVVRDNEYIRFNSEKILELEGSCGYFKEQIAQAKLKLESDESKLALVQEEYNGLKQQIEDKSKVLSEKESQINALAGAIKHSLETITSAKKQILDFAARIAIVRNEIADFSSKQQIFHARQKRLDIEKAKVFEEKAITEDSLNAVTLELDAAKKIVEGLDLRISQANVELDSEKAQQENITVEIIRLDQERLTLESHKEFLEKLKTKYEDMGEAMNAVIYLDKAPREKISGLVVKITNESELSDEDKSYLGPASFKLAGEAKPIELDTQKLEDKITLLKSRLEVLRQNKLGKEFAIDELNKGLVTLQQELRGQEIALANKESSRQTIKDQFSKIKEEEDLICLELQDVDRELAVLEQNCLISQEKLGGLNKEHLLVEDSITCEEGRISENSRGREEVLVVITQTKTELDALNRRISSDEATLNILEETYRQDMESLGNFEKQIFDAQNKSAALAKESLACQFRIEVSVSQIEKQKIELSQIEEAYRKISVGASEVAGKIDTDRKAYDALKGQLHNLKMADKDIEYKFTTIKERILQAYKIDLEQAQDLAQDIDSALLSSEIDALKAKLDSYGTVNLVAIEEYDELKKRYDFLIQQQGDLDTAKESLHQAILKINRTTKQMFLETFQKVREEFRNYFRLLFNGGDAQVYLIDEQDPLESGIEIICRPPGKKLQNVLLLSGGEKAMSAIALIFAIFKVKPSPFCILDEIDAALDEANVDRFSRMLHDFAKGSQFIVITHNKKTIANANVMYGITMEESGVSKIVSVKFKQDKEKLEQATSVEAAVVGK